MKVIDKYKELDRKQNNVRLMGESSSGYAAAIDGEESMNM